MDGLYNEAIESARGWRLAAVFIALLVLIVGVWMATRSRQQKPQTKVNEVTLTRGDVSITVTREGAMTVRTPEGLFEQQWDEQRVRAFFAQFESEDFSRFRRFDETTEGYMLTLVSDGGQRTTFVVPFLDIPIPPSVEELIKVLEEVTSGGGLPSPTPFPTVGFWPTQPPFPTPTQMPFYQPLPTPTPTPTQGGSSGGTDPRQPFTCSFSDPTIRPDVLSETVCTPE